MKPEKNYSLSMWGIFKQVLPLMIQHYPHLMLIKVLLVAVTGFFHGIWIPVEAFLINSLVDITTGAGTLGAVLLAIGIYAFIEDITRNRNDTTLLLEIIVTFYFTLYTSP